MCVSSHWAGDDYHSQIIRNHKDKWPSQWDQSTAILQAGCPKGAHFELCQQIEESYGILSGIMSRHVKILDVLTPVFETMNCLIGLQTPASPDNSSLDMCTLNP